ncbi:hypothetical protein CABS01_02665 [Colletotrichum abscissum]|uniref:Uncharacterized protein n=1 Tax=Colletotrichum abscissum TaxID=1671311 RepID=A0A9P9XR51_9PEZI|nr:uncharacterized protein CABS01_02665 [Colletotrichum abscissum]KAI3558106.1 hypothetical protein CABS02_01779 [Colletotrichum abscissum]KAK1482929.1 hypothetical protein CABS01_02665 [Colletotrichum abscissum]
MPPWFDYGKHVKSEEEDDIVMKIPSEAPPENLPRGGRRERDAIAVIGRNILHPEPNQDGQTPPDLTPNLYERESQHLTDFTGTNMAVPSREWRAQNESVSSAQFQSQTKRPRLTADGVLRETTETQRLRDKNFRLEKRLEEQMTENSNLQAFAASAKKEVDDTKMKLDSLKEAYNRDIRSMQHQIRELNGQIHGLKGRIISYETQKSSNQAIANSNKVSDDAIKSCWKRMAYNIQNIAALYLTACPRAKDIFRHGHSEKSCAVCHMECAHFMLLNNEDLRDSVVEGYIWRAVIRHFFGSDGPENYGKSWAGRPGKLFTALFHDLLAHPAANADPSEIHRWKAASGRMIDRMIGVDEVEMQEVIYAEHQGLVRFIPRDRSGHKAQKSQLYKDLEKIFKDAVELHRVFMRSRAHFYVDWTETLSTTGDVTHYHPDLHEAEVYEKDLDDSSIVKFVISPSLMKIGNADGDSYDKRSRLIKASVICD